jgi:hypothetical protein
VSRTRFESTIADRSFGRGIAGTLINANSMSIPIPWMTPATTCMAFLQERTPDRKRLDQRLSGPVHFAECLMKFHSGSELADQDFHDVRALCERFGIPLPDEFLPFSGYTEFR